jgi:hypothetical protein
MYTIYIYKIIITIITKYNMFIVTLFHWLYIILFVMYLYNKILYVFLFVSIKHLITEPKGYNYKMYHFIYCFCKLFMRLKYYYFYIFRLCNIKIKN